LSEKAKAPPPLTPEQRDTLRRVRVRNYRIKKAHGFRCDKCQREAGVYVVRDGEGDGDEAYGVRCEAHLEGLTRAPGQREPTGGSNA